MALLPASRLMHVFAYGASDLAGPFSVTVGRSLAKRWICLFVCVVTTAQGYLEHWVSKLERSRDFVVATLELKHMTPLAV